MVECKTDPITYESPPKPPTVTDAQITSELRLGDLLKPEERDNEPTADDWPIMMCPRDGQVLEIHHKCAHRRGQFECPRCRAVWHAVKIVPAELTELPEVLRQ